MSLPEFGNANQSGDANIDISARPGSGDIVNRDKIILDRSIQIGNIENSTGGNQPVSRFLASGWRHSFSG